MVKWVSKWEGEGNRVHSYDRFVLQITSAKVGCPFFEII